MMLIKMKEATEAYTLGRLLPLLSSQFHFTLMTLSIRQPKMLEPLLVSKY